MVLGIPKRYVSELDHCKLSCSSSNGLLHFITLLDQGMNILFKPTPVGYRRL